jgi:helicase MOV-10
MAPKKVPTQASPATKSKMIAIPNIHIRQRPPPLTPETSSGRSADVIKDKSQNGSATLPMTQRVVEKQNDAGEPSKTTTERMNWEYDVYAAPFVPSDLRAINMERPGNIITTISRHRIHYQAYTASFTGTAFLHVPPRLAGSGNTQLDLSKEDLTSRFYLEHFASLWTLECLAKEQENEGFAMYKTRLHTDRTLDGHPIWALLVPGLREDSPSLEMGDMLQLRQLWVDGAGNILQVPMNVADPTSAHTRFEYKSWTGVQYDAVVCSVNRAQETVYLLADGLAKTNAGREMVNVTFPVKHRTQHIALAYVDAELKNTETLARYPVGLPTNGDDDFDGFNSSLAVKAITNPTKQQDCGKCNDWIRRILFPEEADGTLQTQLRKMPHRKLFDGLINYEQAHAIDSVCASDYGTLPYLISGPPGTGKTKTLVETAMQMLNSTNVAHILICAPSEAAADTLALRLKQYLSNKQLLRLNRPGRADNEVPRDLIQYCYMENDMFYLPPFRVLMAFNIVVCSCQDAAILAEARVTNLDLFNIENNMFSAFHPEDKPPSPSLHWGALLIDEAAQATEVDVLPAISVVCPPSEYSTERPQPRFVMAGDENQLGPRTASRDPRFSTSLFARLCARPLYRNHVLSRSNIKPSTAPPVLKKSMLPITFPPFTNLIRNYRSHPAILSVPSSLFYNDTLIPEAPTPSTPLQYSSLWRGRKWPVLFLPHTGPDEIERDGGGWYNVSEARLACTIAQTLIDDSHVRQADICIMSPFAAQVKRLRSLIRSKAYGRGSGLWDVNIGPLEAFQGLERRVVIICTTRTRARFLDMDAKRALGIVHQKRKMNVALTRAKEALFVIGNPAVLRHDEHWKLWLAFCWRNGLVSDPQLLWKGGEEDFGREKIGVLERALVAKEDQTQKGKGRALGAGTTGLDMGADYEAWVESLREAMDEEEQRDDEHDEDEEKARG